MLAGLVLLTSKQRSIFLFSGNSAEGRTTGAMHGLINAAIEQQVGSCDCFDFEGSNNANLARFYGSFGAKDSIYLFIRRNRLRGPLKWAKR